MVYVQVIIESVVESPFDAEVKREVKDRCFESKKEFKKYLKMLKITHGIERVEKYKATKDAELDYICRVVWE